MVNTAKYYSILSLEPPRDDFKIMIMLHRTCAVGDRLIMCVHTEQWRLLRKFNWCDEINVMRKNIARTKPSPRLKHYSRVIETVQAD